MVGVEGFEPPTSCSQSRRATRLRYTPVPHGWFGFPGLCHARGRTAIVRSGRCAVNANTPVPAGGRARNPQIGRAHVRTPVTNAHLVCRLELDTTNTISHTSYTTN